MKVDVYHLHEEGNPRLILVLVPEGKPLPTSGLPAHGHAMRLGSFVLGEPARAGLNAAVAREEIASRGFHVCAPSVKAEEIVRPERTRRSRPLH